MNELLKAYIDNELSQAERTRLEAEILSNPSLKAELDEIQATTLYIAESASTIEIRGLEETLTSLPNIRAKQPWFQNPFGILAASTACIALLLTLFFPVFAQSKVASKRAWTTTSEAADMAPSASPADAKAPTNESFATAEHESPNRSRPSEDTLPADPSGQAERASEPGIAASTSPNRLIIKTADLAVRVKDINPAAQGAEAIAKKFGGFVENSSRSNATATKFVYYTIRVDSKRFDQALNEIRALGEVTSESISGDDVTAQVADSEARLKQKRLEEQQYQQVLKSAKKVSEILEVRSYINDIREEIEATEAQIKSLKSLATLSTITLNLQQREEVKPPAPRDWLSNAWVGAMNRSTGLMQGVVAFLINIVVLAPFWLPVALILWWWNRKRTQGTR